MKIQFVKSLGTDVEQLKPIAKSVIEEIYPNYTFQDIPSWLSKEEITWILQKEGSLIFVCLWKPAYELDVLLPLLEFKVKWQHLVIGLEQSNETRLVIVGERISAGLIQTCSSIEDKIEIFELTLSQKEDRVLVEECLKKNLDSALEQDIHNQNTQEYEEVAPLNQPVERESQQHENVSADESSIKASDISLTSFFYKMGRLTESELASFMELESDLHQMNL